jgi:RNA polymerase sigma-70 factor (ECF subfamily)
MKRQLSEKILLHNIITQRDSESFGTLYDRYIEKIFRFVSFKVRSREQAEDLTSEIFLKCWQYLTQSDAPKVKSLSGLLYQIARNRIIDHYREQARNQETDVDVSELQIADNHSLEEHTANKQEAEDLLTKIRQLKHEYQEVVFLKHVEGYSTKEIAEMLGKKKNTIRVTLHRAMKKLQDQLDASA